MPLQSELLKSQFATIAKKKATTFRGHCLSRADKLGIDRACVPMPKEIEAWLLTYESMLETYRKRLYLSCAYTNERVSIANLEIDHRRPISRGGSFGVENLAITTAQNNQRKGNLTADEFLKLLDFLNTLETEAKKDLLARLRSGGMRFKKF
jgi:5-methylcytosine-specific restriction endonuclease McrA